MEFLMEMLKIVWPIVLAGVISLFIILRLKRKFKGRTSNDVTREEIVGAYFMPFGLILGGIVSTIYSMFSSDSLLINLSIYIILSLGVYFCYKNKEQLIIDCEKNNKEEE